MYCDIEPGHSVSHKISFASSENSDQPAPGHLRPAKTQISLQADQSLRCMSEDALGT